MARSVSTKRRSRKGGKRGRLALLLPKATGKLDLRVREVGPERFGIVSVDCAKERSVWMLRDFYGRVLVELSTVEHTGPGLRAMTAALRGGVQNHELGHVVVAIERTGNYHRPVQRACRNAGFETRIVHPFASQHFREIDHPDDKTDEHDLEGIHRATVVGFGLVELPLDENYQRLRLLVRHRRDLVAKTAAVQCQIREHLQATLPGLAGLFKDDKFWNSPVAMLLVRRFASPEPIRKLGPGGMAQLLRDAGVRFQQRTIDKVLLWAEQAIPADAEALVHQRIACDLDDDRLAKRRVIQVLELDIAVLLADTPYVLLLAIPAINVVSAGEFAGEAGPIAHYANPSALTGRSGLYPSRYQSDKTDRKGRMVRSANRRLRAALMLIADNLITINNYFRAQAAAWKKAEVDPRLQRVRIAKRFTRLAYAMLAGRQIIPHPCCRDPHYILDKLLMFHLEHEANAAQVRNCLQAAAAQLPASAQPREAAKLMNRTDEFQQARKPALQSLSSILREVLARRLGVTVQSAAEG
jgi:transposase